MSISIKVKCVEVKKMEGEKGKFIYESRFNTVTGGSPENDNFFRWTPYGGLNFGAVEKDHFEPGKEYYVTLSDVPKSE